MVCHSLFQWTTFCQTSPPGPLRLGWPHMAWLSFIELDTAVVLGSDWLVFCDYGVSVSALWCPLAAPTILLGFLLPWTWGISSQLLQQSADTAPYLGRGVSPHGHASWPWTWNSSSLPSCAHAAATPWMWGSSSLLPPVLNTSLNMALTQLHPPVSRHWSLPPRSLRESPDQPPDHQLVDSQKQKNCNPAVCRTESVISGQNLL